MEPIKTFIPPDIGEDEHIVRRLGWAFLQQWSVIPGDVREQIRQQAVSVEDRHKTVQLNEQINAFIAKHGKGP